jgi:hypothetical protein
VNVSRRNSVAVQRGLGVLTLIFFVLALERFLNAGMAGSEVGSRTAWMLSAAFGLTGTVLLGLLLLMNGADRQTRVDTDTGFSHGRRNR